MHRFTAVLLFLLLACSGAAEADVTVFIYHRFGDDRYPSTNVDIEEFREQMACLMANNYRVIPLADLVKALQEGTSLPPRAAVITIDDGYSSTFTAAWPILRSFGYPFTVFLYTQATDQGWRDHLTWKQVREMQAGGVDFQDHGYAHHRLGSRPEGMNEESYRTWIRTDLLKSAGILAEKLGGSPSYLAVPYGEYNQVVLEEAANLGYEAVLTQNPGSVGEDTDLFHIPREPILGEDWSSLVHFETVLKRIDLPFTDMEPPLAPLLDPAPAHFSARLLHPERYLPGSLGIYVSELGWQKATLAGDVVSIRNTAPLRRRLNRVAVSGKDRETGATAIRFWLLIK